ncbi:MAG TPA: sugar transferase, partial [Candidatus Acidoferrales bacterium]|nr:sugar transferase [Candidatus Acidoferrales bacterium]
IGADAICTLAACYVAGVPSTVAPAAVLLMSGAMAACEGYVRSYAVHWRDEIYHVVVACAVAAIPFWILLHAVGALSNGTAFFALGIDATLIAALRATFHVARHHGDPPAYARVPFVTPQAQWRVGHSMYGPLRRCVDVVLGSLGLIVLSPVMLLAAAAVAIESGTPVLFVQTRVGRCGNLFKIYKFRTMVRDAGSGWARPSDARITRLGAFLRRTSIDELPQLFNVLRGDMCLVGPRPEMEEFAREFRRTIPHYDERSFVPPGVTGWAQVQLERNLEPKDMPQVVPYDLFYVEHASTVFDGIIILKTAVEFLFHRAV